MYLFLDIDGVLHPADRRNGLFSRLQDFEEAIRQLPPLSIVISSSWRVDHSIAELRSFFSPDVADRVVGVTPYLSDGVTELQYGREKEIRAWLDKSARPSDAWAALDDTEWMFSPGCKQLVLVNSET